MIVVMNARAAEADIERVVSRIEQLGLASHIVHGTERTVIGVIGDERKLNKDQISLLPQVEEVIPILKPYKLASREFKPADSVVDVGGVPVGGSEVIVMAGPCSVESRKQLFETAEAVAASGATVLRGGAFKPRTSPYEFQGHGEEGLRLLAEAGERYGLAVVTEVVDPHDVELVSRYAQCLQIGARNMQNYVLLREVGRGSTPVLLKRGGMYPTIENWLLAAEYVLQGGNRQVILCERGLPVAGDASLRRNLLDLTAVPIARELSHLPIVVDPSHGTGRQSLISVMSKGAIAVGADGLIVEVHPHPDKAWSDGQQSLRPEVFAQMMRELPAFAIAAGRTL